MKKSDNPFENEATYQTLPDVLRNCSVSLCVVAQSMIELDPNDYYARYMVLVDSITTTAEVLKEVHDQSKKYTHGMWIKLPVGCELVHLEQLPLWSNTEESVDDSADSTSEMGDEFPF